MTENRYEAVAKWQKETFPKASSLSKLAHLKLEVEELINDIKTDSHLKHLEFADCFLLLFGAAKAEGMTYKDILDCIDEKFDINQNRTWGTPNELGIVNHIKI